MNKWSLVKTTKINKRWMIAAASAVIVVIAVIGTLSSGIAVDSAYVEKGEVIKLIKESGTVESKSSIIITAKNTGEVKGLKISEGDEVNEGDTLMTSGGTSAELDIKSLQAELSGLQVQYTQARDIANKNKTLYDQGALSYEAYNQSNTAAKQLAAQVSSLEYSIKSYEESTGATGVTAPIGGIITGVFVKEGETVMPGAKLFEISNLNDRYIKVDLIAEDADLVKTGDTVRAYNDDTNFNDNSCRVKKIHLKAQEKISDLGVNQRRVTIEIEPSEADGIRLGSSVDVEITVDKKDNVLRVSDMAIFEIENKKHVYVIKSGKAELRQIETGIEGEDFTEIISGLSEGEQIIISPNEDIQDGSKVKAE